MGARRGRDWGGTSLQAVHGQRVAAGRKDLAHFPNLRVVRAVQLFAHKEALLEVLERLKRLALLLHRGVHLVMLPQPPLHVVHLVRRKPRAVRHRGWQTRDAARALPCAPPAPALPTLRPRD